MKEKVIQHLLYLSRRYIRKDESKDELIDHLEFPGRASNESSGIWQRTFERSGLVNGMIGIVECLADFPSIDHSRRFPFAERFRPEDFPDLLNIFVNMSGREDHVGQ